MTEIALTDKQICQRNIKLSYVLSFVYGLTFFFPILALYYEQSLFSVHNIALIYAAEAITITIFEVPTGVIADLFGRRRTMIIDGLISLASLTFLYIGGSMFNFIVAAILQAIGLSLSSGAENALIYDSLKAAKREKEYKKVIGRYYSSWQLGAAIAAVIGGYLAAISLKTPIFYTFIPYSIGAILFFFFIEPRYHKSNKSAMQHFKKSYKLILSNRTLIFLMLGTALFFGFEEGLHNLKPLFLKFKDVDIVIFGYIYFCTFGLAALGYLAANPVAKKLGDKNTAIIFTTLILVFLHLATHAHGMWAAILLTIPSFFFGIKGPAIEHIMQKHCSSGMRATMLSIMNLTNQFALAICIPMVGLFADQVNINFAQQITTLLMILSPVLYIMIKD